MALLLSIRHSRELLSHPVILNSLHCLHKMLHVTSALPGHAMNNKSIWVMRLHYSARSQLGLFGKKTENNWKRELLCAITDRQIRFQ